MSSLAARKKQRNYRCRQRQGLAVLRIPVQHRELAEALISAGRLTPSETLNRLAVEHEIARLIEEWRSQWAAAC